MIVIFTSHFPSLDCPEKSYATAFLVDYANEWIKAGENVHIIHFARKYPIAFSVVERIASAIGNNTLTRYVIHEEAAKDKEYEYHGIKIHRKSYKKYIPHRKTSKMEKRKLAKYAGDIFKSIGNPRVIIGDCIDPVSEIIWSACKDFDCPKLQILHDSDIPMINDKKTRDVINNYDALLLRSKKQKAKVDSILGNKQYKYLYMYSGITDNQINRKPNYRFKIQKLIYVGALFKTKGLSTVLEALSSTNNKNLSLDIIGDGIDRDYFVELSDRLNIRKQVFFHGKKPHDEVFGLMSNADALVLISRETFGMVYVEAMSQACIPIGAKNEGIDGIIEHGHNGYLTTLGDSESLKQLFDSFENIPERVIESVSKEAYETSKELLNSRLAEALLKKINAGDYLI